MWLDRRHNVICYDTPLADRVAKTVPGSKRLSNGYVCVPNTLYSIQLCRWLGLEVPAPMDGVYAWPGRYKPFLAQSVTANFLCANPRAFVLSDMGTGKTLAALWAADFVLDQFPGVRCLIVCPLSTMQRVWADAIFTHFLGRRRCVVLHGSAAKRRELLATPGIDFYIINFDGLGVIAAELANRSDIRMAIVDEASAYRDRTTNRHKLARKLLATKDYLWMMTGTPTPNGPEDAYGMAKLVNNANGESFYSYQDRVTTKISLYKRVPKSGSHAAAMALLQPSVRFSIDQCVDLPPMTVQTRDVELSGEQQASFKELKNELVLQAKAGPITAANEAVLRSKLIQISCGAIYHHAARDGSRAVHRLDCSPRLSALREVIEQSADKIIIFAPLTSIIHLIYNELKDDYACAVINGPVSPKERNEIIRSFEQDKNPRILIADPGCMAHGLTLVAATVTVWYGPTDSTEEFLQANKRFHRPGQTKPCTVVLLAATTIEREIYRRLQANETLMGALLKMVQEG